MDRAFDFIGRLSHRVVQHMGGPKRKGAVYKAHYGTVIGASLIIGIDPGVRGCIALLDISTGAAQFFDMPVIRYKKEDGKKCTIIDEDGLLTLIRSLAGPYVACVVVERQQAFFKGGIASTFKLAYNYGLMLGTIRSIPVLASSLDLVKPREWKQDLGLSKTDEMTIYEFKELSRQLALKLFPGAAGSLKRKKDEGRAEALLIAEWGRRHVLRKYIPAYRSGLFEPGNDVIASVCEDAIHRASTD